LGRLRSSKTTYKAFYHPISVTVEAGVLTVLYKNNPTDKVAFRFKTTLPFFVDYDEEIPT
jgi:hypothetical protein